MRLKLRDIERWAKRFSNSFTKKVKRALFVVVDNLSGMAERAKSPHAAEET